MKFVAGLLLLTYLALPCQAQKASTANIPANLRFYRASITVDYRGKRQVTVKVWNPDALQKSLNPWRSYVDYILTGRRDTIRFGCRDKRFRIREVSQKPKASSGILYDTAGHVGASLSDLSGINTITFVCYALPTAE
ncbi:MAG TPA: hypothetical protein VL913_00300 [Candidatus Micrarchaeaceae archaeon]|nr:hypothetical protein [Candidatus Micrarchaeaceae archaeon]